MYFKIFKPISWDKRPAERRRRFIQRFLSIFEFGDHFGGTVLAAGGSAGMGRNLSTTQAYVTFGSAGISGMGNMGGQPGSFGGMQPPQNGGQPGQMPGSGSQPGQPEEGQQPGGDPPAMPGSDNSSGNAI